MDFFFGDGLWFQSHTWPGYSPGKNATGEQTPVQNIGSQNVGRTELGVAIS